MGSTHQFRITLPADLAELVEQKVRSGDYASVSDVVREGVSALLDEDTQLERWLREDVVAGHAEYLADPTRAVSAEHLVERYRKKRVSSSPAD